MYKSGDYIILKDSDLWYKNYAIISKYVFDKYYIKVFFPVNYGKRYFFNKGDGSYRWVEDSTILRHMTDIEKKELNFLLDIDKYNL